MSPRRGGTSGRRKLDRKRNYWKRRAEGQYEVSRKRSAR